MFLRVPAAESRMRRGAGAAQSPDRAPGFLSVQHAEQRGSLLLAKGP